DEVKTDRFFVAKVSGPHGMPILSSLVSLSSQLGLRLIAQGIETADEERLLVDAGCEIGQGFLYRRPMPAADLTALL
ncbi:EAL domain-containing protein, partial [Acinetobacter baumannii]